MDNTKDDKYYIVKILADVNFLIKHTKGLERIEFVQNEILLDSIMFRFIQISEHIKNLSTAFTSNHNEIPWRDIIGLRNRIVHEYGKVDLNIIYDAVTVDIYDLQKQFNLVYN